MADQVARHPRRKTRSDLCFLIRAETALENRTELYAKQRTKISKASPCLEAYITKMEQCVDHQKQQEKVYNFLLKIATSAESSDKCCLSSNERAAPPISSAKHHSAPGAWSWPASIPLTRTSTVALGPVYIEDQTRKTDAKIENDT